MDKEIVNSLPEFIDTLGMTEEPMGIYFDDNEPTDGFSPKDCDLPTAEKEEKNEIDWQNVFGQFSCIIGNIWKARKKNKPAYFSAEKFGCPGGAFWSGFLKPQTQTIIKYVSSGVPGHMEGEHYCDSPENLQKMFEYVDPVPAKKKYCIFKSLSTFEETEEPELVTFFVRPEVLSGLHQLAAFVTNDPEVVVSPWGAACGNLVAWPLHYHAKGDYKAVLGGWDPSARKFMKTDELTFTVPYKMYKEMIDRYKESFLSGKVWGNVKKKIERSKKAWKEV